MTISVLLVEDEHRVADMIQRGLSDEGFVVNTADSGEEALGVLESNHFDVVVLDLMLPGIGGHEVCGRLRATGNQVPVLMLTALGDVSDRVLGLGVGADDYMGKPFDFGELIARLQALARRAGIREKLVTDPHLIRNGNLAFNARTFEALADGRTIALTAREREIFRLLLASADRTVSRDRIANAVWKTNEKVRTNIVDVYVSRLRRKLGVPGERIITVRGVGYRLIANTARVAAVPVGLGNEESTMTVHDKESKPRAYASPACLAHEIDPAYRVPSATDPQQCLDVARWRKAERIRLLADRLTMPLATRQAAANKVAAQLQVFLLAKFGSLAGLTISAWWPIKAEFDLRPWLQGLAAQGATAALPVVLEQSAPLTFRVWANGTRMERGFWNIPVPAEGSPVTPDITLAPVVGWDDANFRLGYGGGYFDRTLAALVPRPLAIGIGFEAARIGTIFPQPHDIPMAVILTENGVRATQA